VVFRRRGRQEYRKEASATRGAAGTAAQHHSGSIAHLLSLASPRAEQRRQFDRLRIVGAAEDGLGSGFDERHYRCDPREPAARTVSARALKADEDHPKGAPDISGRILPQVEPEPPTAEAARIRAH